MKFTRVLSVILALLLLTALLVSCGDPADKNLRYSPEEIVQMLRDLGYNKQIVYTANEQADKAGGTLVSIIHMNTNTSEVFLVYKYTDKEFAAYGAEALAEQIRADTEGTYAGCEIERHGQWVLCAKPKDLAAFQVEE